MSSNFKEELTFTPRPYQLEILNEALQKNTIVCLGTGTGKTFISVMLIRELADGIKGTLRTQGKRTFFIVNTVTLVFQQSKAIERHTNLKVGKYSGDMGVDFWEKQRWETEFDKNDVLVMTAQILLNIVTHGFIKLSNINLLLFDECHHASGNHPYAQLMQKMSECPRKPRIMGLTASVINKRPKNVGNLHNYVEESIRILETMMMSTCTTCSDQNSTLQYAAKPSEIIVPYNNDNLQTWPQVLKIQNEIVDLLMSAKNFLDQVECRNDEAESCKLTIKELIDIEASSGLWCLYKAVLIMENNTVKEVERCLTEEDRIWAKYRMTIIRQVKRAFQDFAAETFGGVLNIIPMEPLITPKVMLLLDQLRERRQNLCAIVFVERRITCTVLSDLINDIVTCFGESYAGIISDFIHGHSIEDVLRGSTMSSKNQDRILERFRNGHFNVLVSTSVVEEGVDVRKCNLVIKFDGIKNYREYVQSKGRARAHNGAFVIITEIDEVNRANLDLMTFREIENILNARCLLRQPPTQNDIRQFFDVDPLIKPFKASDEIEAATISMHNAVQLLYMYCSKLPSDAFTTCQPVFDIESDNMNGYTGTVKLPLSSPLREIVRGDCMPTKKMARVSAAQKVCICLYELGELDDNFLPIKECEDSKEDDDMCNDYLNGNEPSKQIYARKIPDCFMNENEFPFQGLYLYAVKMILNKPREGKSSKFWNMWYEEQRRFFCFFTTQKLPKISSFPLFTRAGEVNVQTPLLISDLSLEPIQLRLIARFHEKIMQEFGNDFVNYREFSLERGKVKLLLAPTTKEICSCLEQDVTMFSPNQNRQQKQLERFIDFKILKSIIEGPVATRYSFEDAIVKKTYAEPGVLYYVLDVRFDKKVTDRIAVGKETFAEYYKAKYEKNIKANQPLLECVRSDSRFNYLTPRYTDEFSTDVRSNSVKSNDIYLVPELCQKISMPASFFCQAVCIPSVLFRLETILIAKELQMEICREVNLSKKYNPSKRVKFSEHGKNDDVSEIIRVDKRRAKNGLAYSVNADDFFEEDRNILKKKHVEEVNKSLRKALSKNHIGINNEIPLTSILQTLTTRKANAGFDLERFEILGDSFLKLAVSIMLYFKYDCLNEGRLTKKRANYISNKSLSELAKKKNIQGMITNTAFGLKQTGKEKDEMYDLTYNLWIPPLFVDSPRVKKDTATYQGAVAAPSQAIGRKTLADSVEALIGAFYVHDGVLGALHVMKWFGVDCFFSATGKENKEFPISGYADFPPPSSAADQYLYSANCLYHKQRYQSIEDHINYCFKNKYFLVQSMTHMSYDFLRVTDCYQKLEFLGDSILDFLVVSHLYEYHPELEPGVLTDIKSALVNNNTFALLAVKHKLYKGLLYSSPSLMSSINSFVSNIEIRSVTVNSLLQNPFIIVFNDDDEEGYNAPKVLGDIFESIAGAVFMDSGLDLAEVWKVFYPMLHPLIDAYTKTVPLNPVRELHERYPQATKSCKELLNGKIECTWMINGQGYSGVGQNKVMAKATSAQRALKILKK